MHLNLIRNVNGWWRHGCKSHCIPRSRIHTHTNITVGYVLDEWTYEITLKYRFFLLEWKLNEMLLLCGFSLCMSYLHFFLEWTSIRSNRLKRNSWWHWQHPFSMFYLQLDRYIIGVNLSRSNAWNADKNKKHNNRNRWRMKSNVYMKFMYIKWDMAYASNSSISQTHDHFLK